MTKQEYTEKYEKNQKFSGGGADTTVHMPCPFCAEPDFVAYRVLEAEEALGQEKVCAHCGRGARCIVTRQPPGETRIELVQTRGDDPPSFLPKMRRV